jgi:hypothetical protein
MAPLIAPLIPAFADERRLNPGRGDRGWLVSRRGARVPVRTRYATSEERFSLEVTVGAGGRLLWCRDARPVDSTRMYAGLRRWDRERPVHRGLYAIERRGDLFLGDPSQLSPDAAAWVTRRPGAPLPSQVALWHHSSFVGGEPVICAGDLDVRDGRILAISSWSGHYKPLPGHLAAAIAELRDRGADLAGAVAEVVVDGRIRAYEALPFAADPDGAPEVTASWRRAQAIAAAEEVTGTPFGPADHAELERRLAVLAGDPDGFDPDAQVHWNWTARWVLEDRLSGGSTSNSG